MNGRRSRCGRRACGTSRCLDGRVRTRKIYHQNALAATNGANQQTQPIAVVPYYILLSTFPPSTRTNVANQPHRVVGVGTNYSTDSTRNLIRLAVLRLFSDNDIRYHMVYYYDTIESRGFHEVI